MKDLYENAPTTKSILPSKDQKREVRHGNAFRILDRPVITEKATALIAGNKYVFAVAGDANKIEISKAIEEVYGIRPTDVNIIKMRGKTVTRGRYKGKRKNWKKAIVTLPKGKTIEVYEGV